MYVKILLDSGASASIVNNSYARGNNILRKTSTCTWSTIAGTFNTSSLMELNIKLPELNHTVILTVDFHVSNVVVESAKDIVSVWPDRVVIVKFISLFDMLIN